VRAGRALLSTTAARGEWGRGVGLSRPIRTATPRLDGARGAHPPPPPRSLVAAWNVPGTRDALPSSSVTSSLGSLRCRRERRDCAAGSQQAKWRGWSRLPEPRLAVQVRKPLSSARFQAPVRAKPRSSRGIGRLLAAALNAERKEYSYYNWWSVAGSWPRRREYK
jgi:hypothetical protein